MTVNGYQLAKCEPINSVKSHTQTFESIYSRSLISSPNSNFVHELSLAKHCRMHLLSPWFNHCHFFVVYEKKFITSTSIILNYVDRTKKKVEKEISLFLVAEFITLFHIVRVVRIWERVRCLTRNNPDLYWIQWLHIFDVWNETSCFRRRWSLCFKATSFALNGQHGMKSCCHGNSTYASLRCNIVSNIIDTIWEVNRCENREPNDN